MFQLPTGMTPFIKSLTYGSRLAANLGWQETMKIVTQKTKASA